MYTGEEEFTLDGLRLKEVVDHSFEAWGFDSMVDTMR